MILGTGCDLAECSRFANAAPSLLDKILTDQEKAYCLQYAKSSERIAAKFAAKEAVLKALGTGWSQGIHWTDIEIVHDTLGKPQVILKGNALAIAKSQGNFFFHISISHIELFAMAFAIWEKI